MTVWWLPEGQGGEGEVVKGKGDQIYGESRILTLGGKHRMQYTGDVLEYFTLETYIILLTSVTPIHFI